MNDFCLNLDITSEKRLKIIDLESVETKEETRNHLGKETGLILNTVGWDAGLNYFLNSVLLPEVKKDHPYIDLEKKI